MFLILSRGSTSISLSSTYFRQCSSQSSKTSANDINTNYDVVPHSLDLKESIIKYGLTTIGFPLAFLNGWFAVGANHKCVITNFGKYSETIPEGLHWRSFFATGMNTPVFIGKQTYDLTLSKIVDKNGNPVVVSGTVNYHINNPEQYIINIGGNINYLHNQAEIVLKRVTSEYPYESKNEECLIREGQSISARMTNELQKMVSVAGIHIENFYLTDLSYAPEIAQQMLIRQRALAYIDAKDTIGNASVDIVKQIVEDTESKCNLQLDDITKRHIISQLLVVITSETGVQPVLTLGNS